MIYTINNMQRLSEYVAEYYSVGCDNECELAEWVRNDDDLRQDAWEWLEVNGYTVGVEPGEF